MFQFQVDIPTHFDGAEFVRVSSVSLDLKSFLKSERLKCLKDEKVERVGTEEAKSQEGQFDINCSTSKVRCTTYR